MDLRSTTESVFRFESLCRSLLIELGYVEDTDILYISREIADFVGIDRTVGSQLVAEFKLTLSGRARPEYLNQAISSLLKIGRRFPNAKLLLIMACPVPLTWVNTAKAAGISEIWDLDTLLLKARPTPVFAPLHRFLHEVGVPGIELNDEPQEVENSEPQTAVPFVLAPPENRGTLLCEQINNVTFDSAGWTEFERVCIEALIHLFGEQFGKHYPQSVSNDGVHRRDLLVRLLPKHDFWKALAYDFRSRYVVFEFKNYKDKIGQDQIYSTEKYLFTTALRSVCFIIARSGADENAYRAAAGALREAGKLIIIITGEKFCEMLRASDGVMNQNYFYTTC